MVDNEFKSAGDQVVVEEFLDGFEVSAMAVTDGYTVLEFPLARDHKRQLDGDKGPNTGGMGCVAPVSVSPAVQKSIANILRKTVDGMRREGYPFVGVLFAGLMVCDERVYVLEFNCRMGDPETQTLLPLLQCDLVEIMLAAAEHRLDSVEMRFSDGYSACVIAASEGYPNKYEKGHKVTVNTKELVFHGGTNEKMETSGGRVLAVVGLGVSLEAALASAYTGMNSVDFKGKQFRRDIGKQSVKKHSMSYADAGVSIDRGNQLVEKIKPLVKATRRPGTDAEIGGFGGLFSLTAANVSPNTILVAATDGVGTKLLLAQQTGIHHTIGVDLVAMSVNDLLVQGAEPLFFLDYYACGHLDVEVAAKVISGIAEGCLQAKCALLGGETAEMPGMYGDKYDLAGFAVGASCGLLPRTTDMEAGDILLGLPSSGPHSNGYSLIRKLVDGLSLDSLPPFESHHLTLAQALLAPTTIYVSMLLPIMPHILGLAHITGGGFIDNLPRVLPAHLAAHLHSWPLPPLFSWLQQRGNITTEEMRRTFNCGYGMVVVVKQSELQRVMELLPSAVQIGTLQQRNKEAVLFKE